MDALDAIAGRRSIKKLIAPGPGPEELDTLLAAAQAAPDHGELRPWRFSVLTGEEKDAFGQVFVDALVARCARRGAEATPGQIEKEATKLGRAPTVVVVGAAYQPSDKIPVVEQFAAVAAAVQNLLLAATALGYGSMWRTGDQAYDDEVKAAVGLRPEDAIVGFVYLGTVPGPA